jgi:hypothetical protein
MNDLDDRIYALEEAQSHLEEALDLVRQAVRGTRLADRTDAYIIPPSPCASTRTTATWVASPATWPR